MGRLKHRLKLLARELYARALYHTGLHALVNRALPRRQTILFGHCVDAPACNGFLPGDMKIARARLARILDWFARRYAVLPVAAGFRSVCEDGAAARSVVSLSMDDGYRDNATELLPLLRERGLAATVFLETRPLDERRVNWSHKYFWCLAHGATPAELARRYADAGADAATAQRLRALLEAGGDLAYQVKRVLKYEADPDDRERVVDALFREEGGDERALCDALYLSWDEARTLRDAGFELGGHTVTHAILARLDRPGQMREVEACAASLERALGERSPVFAYPFGRRWDYSDESCAVVGEAGFALAVNTHAGTNDAGSDRKQLRRVPIDQSARLHLLVAEACGGFDLLRRVGLDLSE